MKVPLIAIIDDDEETRVALSGLMRAKGFGAQTFESAEDFLEANAYESSQCIITDIQMPGLSGFELKHRLDDAKCTVPVIMVTARVDQPFHALALESGAFHMFRKPFKAEELLACVEKAIAAWSSSVQAQVSH